MTSTLFSSQPAFILQYCVAKKLHQLQQLAEQMGLTGLWH